MTNSMEKEKSKIPSIKSKDFDNGQPGFQNVNYTPLHSDAKLNASSKRKFSNESTNAFDGLKRTTYYETMMHLIKGNVGCGVLALGMAFKSGGLIVSVIMVIIFSIISCYNQHLLISMANEFKCAYNLKTITFAETIGIAFDTGPPIFQKFSSLIRKSITFFIVSTQLGCCSVYLLFTSNSLGQVLNCYDIVIDIHILMAIVLPFVWITSLIKQLKYIAPLSLLANISTFGALILILRSSTSNLPPITDRQFVGRWQKIPLCIGTAVFSLEGISMALPLQQNMKKKEQFLGIGGTLNLSLFFSTALMLVIGFFGYWKFGDGVKEMLTENLEISSIVPQIIIICLMVGILCTYALQFFIPVQLILPKINKASVCPNNEYFVRSALVLLTFFMAEIIPHFNLFASLLGAIGGTFLAFIFCPLADVAFRKRENRGKFNWRLIVDYISLIIGIIGFLSGTAVTTKDVVIALMKDLGMYK